MFLATLAGVRFDSHLSLPTLCQYVRFLPVRFWSVERCVRMDVLNTPG